MSDHLQLDHWLDRAIQILKDDAGVATLSYSLLEKGDLMYLSTGGDLVTNLPAITVGIRDVIEEIEGEISGDTLRYEIPLRVVLTHDFEQSDSVMEAKTGALGKVHGAFWEVWASSTSWTTPNALTQFFRAAPSDMEMQPPEEAIFHAIGIKQIWCAALTVRLQAQARIA